MESLIALMVAEDPLQLLPNLARPKHLVAGSEAHRLWGSAKEDQPVTEMPLFGPQKLYFASEG